MASTAYLLRLLYLQKIKLSCWIWPLTVKHTIVLCGLVQASEPMSNLKGNETQWVVSKTECNLLFWFSQELIYLLFFSVSLYCFWVFLPQWLHTFYSFIHSIWFLLLLRWVFTTLPRLSLNSWFQVQFLSHCPKHWDFRCVLTRLVQTDFWSWINFFRQACTVKKKITKQNKEMIN